MSDNIKTDGKIDTRTLEEKIGVIPKIIWGQLAVLRRESKKIDLNKMVFTVGREDCDLNISPDEMSTKHLQFISNIHFQLKKDITPDAPVYLKDLSRNGTFVNGENIGRGNIRILQDDDEIAIANQSWKVFKFYDRYVSGYSDMPMCIKEKYYISRKLGVGATGTVRLIYNKRTCAKYAMKHITKNNVNPSKIMNEANILKKLHHPFIVKIYELEETPEAIFLILELMEGGNLYTRIAHSGHLNEHIVKHILYQLAVAVNYLHGKKITHRDLKPSNILLQNLEEKTTLKLSDFDLSKVVDEGSCLRTKCGTRFYVAPEILMNHVETYTDKVDIWSMGVILFVCLSGCMPFSDSNCSLVEQICHGKYSFTQPIWNTVSTQCKDLINKMLTVDPRERLSSSEVLQHEWLQDSKVKEEYSHLLNKTQNENQEITVSDLGDSFHASLKNSLSEDNDEPPLKRQCEHS